MPHQLTGSRARRHMARLCCIATTSLACTSATLLPAAPASAKGVPVKLVTKPGTVPVGTQANAWFKVPKGARCHLVGRRGHQKVSGRMVLAGRPLLQYHWKVPIRAREGTWRIALTCSRRGRTGAALTKLEVQGGATRRGAAVFRRGMRPAQAGVTTSGSGRGAGSWQPFGTVIVAGAEWLGGAGVDVKSNGGVGCYNSCLTSSGFGIAYQCVELVQRLIATKNWSPKIWGDAYQLYDNASLQHFDKHANGSGYVPVPGDIIVWHGGYGGYGHVAVVEWIADGRVGWVEQNSSASGRSSGVIAANGTLGSNGALVPTGILHAKANVPVAPPPAVRHRLRSHRPRCRHPCQRPHRRRGRCPSARAAALKASRAARRRRARFSR